MARTPATISRPASVGWATLPISEAKTTRISSMNRPEKIAAHLVRAPDATFNAVWPTEPPTG